MPMQRERYPPNWEAVSRRIRERAQNRCEWCGAPNHTIGYRRASDSTFVAWECDGDLPEVGKRVKIILTVAHLGAAHPDGTPGDKHDKNDVRDENLAALCQRCHLLYDIDEHRRNAAETRRRKKVAGGQREMPL